MHTGEDPTMTTAIAHRIRALLDKAESSEYTHERDAFTAKAMALMAEYRITEAMLDAARDPQARRGRITEREILLGSGPYVRARLGLLCQVADANSASVVTHVGWDGRVATVNGYESDLSRIEMLYTSLLVQATQAATRLATPRGVSTVSVRRSFLFGFAASVGERLTAANETAARSARQAPDAKVAETSVALVLADRRADVDDYVRQRYGRLGTLRAAPVSRDGYGEGRVAGSRADLGTNRSVDPAARGAIGA